jgi:predicted porin
LKALTINDDVAQAPQTMASDSSIAGQVFNGAAYAGISSKHFGTVAFGRQMTLLADGVSIYDPIATSQAFSVIGTSLAGTVSDNETCIVMGSYKIKRIKLFRAYGRIKYKNPSDPLTTSAGGSHNTIGGYTIAYANLNQNAYAIPKKIDLFWLGAQLSVTRKISLWGAYYHFHQNSYATGTHAGCTTAVNSGCSGDLQAMSAVAIYSVAKRRTAMARPPETLENATPA